MLASLLRPRNRQQPTPNSESRPLLYKPRPTNDPPAREESGSSDEGDFFGNGQHDGNEDDDDDNQPLLPIFSAEILDRIPIYHAQHSIRLLVLGKVETTLSWDQLRSPQVSQFLVKPLSQNIKQHHFSRGTYLALIANCLQFKKDAEMHPGSAGVFRTRALVCELLAMRLLKESSTRELIDALFYDFDPLQGMQPPTNGQIARLRANARISAVEIAIRAQAKRFLAHPLVVQQLEAIWKGTIVFHSAADTLHRKSSRQMQGHTAYGATDSPQSSRTVTNVRPQVPRQKTQESWPLIRRTVSLYDPSDASPFKLSRLRVPLYRQIFSTLSYAIMLGLFIAVLMQRSLEITGLELVFWFWSAGYMLDELVGFTEQGFGLYIMSVWNAFDIGILVMFVVYYVLRLYGILIPSSNKKEIASYAYDTLASTAVLLFPRLFSVLDHYRYFSQLLIAFRMMFLDLVAVLLLILIACSGFFAAFTLAFPVDLNASTAAYALFQLLMGFTPAAWEIWDDYNILGKIVLTMFLIITHFLIVTILITVLTNSFMAVINNANDEHQFLFAVNTISLVKSESLFAYIAPMNVFGWVLAPLRYVLTFRHFVKLNRTLIKLTHLPILFLIWGYEGLILARHVYEPTDLVEQRGRHTNRQPAFTLRGPGDLFSPGARLREPSVTTFHKDRVLEEVFRQPFRAPSDLDGGRDDSRDNRQRTTIVHDWMRSVGPQGPHSPMEQAREELDRLETRRPGMRRFKTSHGPFSNRRGSSFMAPSAVSDPEDTRTVNPRQYRTIHEEGSTHHSIDDLPQQTDADGDDELATNDEDDHEDDTHREQSDNDSEIEGSDDDDENEGSTCFQTPTTVRALDTTPLYHTAATTRQLDGPISPKQEPVSPSKHARRRTAAHTRTTSSATILFSPLLLTEDDMSRKPLLPVTTSPPQAPPPKRAAVASTARNSGNEHLSGTATPRRSTGKRSGALTPLTSLTSNDPAMKSPVRVRHILPPSNANQSTPNLAGFLALDRRRPSFNAMALDLASDLGDNRIVPDAIGAFPASFGTQLDMNIAALRREQQERQRGSNGDNDTTRRLNKLMLARMEKMELGFQEMLREVKGLNKDKSGSKSLGASRAPSSAEDNTTRNVTKGKAKRGSREKTPKFVFGPLSLAESPGAMTDDFEAGSKLGLPSTSL
ncbi:hypothetical protein EG328_006684 [Venturia inaequalis]|uniref:Ion transport domain-containing protein n=1 Tax=Venturia inaequalis TaxID=5025 RepID=A0A8H3UIC5_VENIN|nr:hypothetical protein EG328_006684 [Venturia inaequalis]